MTGGTVPAVARAAVHAEQGANPPGADESDEEYL